MRSRSVLTLINDGAYDEPSESVAQPVQRNRRFGICARVCAFRNVRSARRPSLAHMFQPHSILRGMITLMLVRAGTLESRTCRACHACHACLTE